MHQNCGMFYQYGVSDNAVLRSYRHKKGIRMGKSPMTSVAVNKMITKFEAICCLDGGSCSGRPDTYTTAARTVQEEMENLANLFFVYAWEKSELMKLQVTLTFYKLLFGQH